MHEVEDIASTDDSSESENSIEYSALPGSEEDSSELEDFIVPDKGINKKERRALDKVLGKFRN